MQLPDLRGLNRFHSQLHDSESPLLWPPGNSFVAKAHPAGTILKSSTLERDLKLLLLLTCSGKQQSTHAIASVDSSMLLPATIPTPSALLIVALSTWSESGSSRLSRALPHNPPPWRGTTLSETPARSLRRQAQADLLLPSLSVDTHTRTPPTRRRRLGPSTSPPLASRMLSVLQFHTRRPSPAAG